MMKITGGGTNSWGKSIFPIVFTGILSWGIGLVAYHHIFKENDYTFPPHDVLFPKNPIMECMKDDECTKRAEAGYFEARSEDDLAVILVFQNIQNRVENRRWANDTIGVIEQPRQYSYTHDGSLKKKRTEPEQWNRMLLLSYNFQNGLIEVPEEFKLVTHYHDKSVKNPWGFKEVVQVGSFTGYQCTGYC